MFPLPRPGEVGSWVLDRNRVTPRAGPRVQTVHVYSQLVKVISSDGGRNPSEPRLVARDTVNASRARAPTLFINPKIYGREIPAFRRTPAEISGAFYGATCV